MSLFTEKERGDLCYMHDDDPEILFDATVAAVLEKLAAGVSVEPAIQTMGALKAQFFTLDQLQTAVAAARVQMAKAIKDAYMEGFFAMTTYNDTQTNDEDAEWEKSEAKRALLGKEAT